MSDSCAVPCAGREAVASQDGRLAELPEAVASLKSKRDTRIDALRGIALLMIFIDHVPDDAANWLTIHNFSFSDAAEVFVYLAGVSSMLAYGKAFRRDGALTGFRQIAARCTKIYAVQVVLFLTTMGLAVVRRSAGMPNPIAGPILDAGWAGIFRGLSLEALPTYLDILPLYVVLLAAFPIVYALSRISPWLALSVSGSVWLAANLCKNFNLPNMLSAEGWYFNPFAWQFLFTIGSLSAGLLKGAQSNSLRGKLLKSLCWAYLAVGFFETFNWSHWGLPDLRLFSMEEPEKTVLAPIRLLSILAVVCLVFGSAAVERLSRYRFMQPLAACGRHSLEVFAMGCVLAYAGRFLFQVVGTGLPLQIFINVGGIGLTFLVAWMLEWRRGRQGSDTSKGSAGGYAAAAIKAGR